MSDRTIRAPHGTQDGPPDAPVVAASYALYRLLLHICPPRFRQRYGEEMAQVFRDCCRETWRAASARGLLALWGHALLDLMVTAISVWRKEGMVMPTQSVMRVAALAGLVAGAWSGCIALGLVLLDVTIGPAWLIWELHGVESALLMTYEAPAPALWALWALGLVGLHLYLDRGARERAATGERWLIWIACALTCLGALLIVVEGPVTLGRFYDWYDALRPPFIFNPWRLRMASAIVMGIGIALTSALTLRREAFGRLRWLLLGVSVLALLNASYALVVLWLLISAPVGTVNVIPGLNVFDFFASVTAFWNLLWGALWIPLGLRLWSLAGATPPTRSAPSLAS